MEDNGIPLCDISLVGNYNSYLIFKMDSRIVKILSERKLAPQLDIWVGATLQNTSPNDKIHKIKTWNERTMFQGGKLQNIKMEMKKLDIDILGLCGMRWPNNRDFLSNDYKIIYTNNINGLNDVEIILNKK